MRRTVGDAPWLPPITMLGNCMLWTCYGILIENTTVILVNAIGLVCAVFCLITYYRFSMHRQHELFVQALCICSASLLAILLIARYGIDSYHSVGFLGLVSSAFSVALFGSPLVKLYHVVTVTKSAAGLPLTQTVLGALCSTSWALYGYLLQDWYMFTPNFLGCLLSLLQVGIFWVYQARTPELMQKAELSLV